MHCFVMLVCVFDSLPLCAGKEWRKKQIRKISDKVFERIKNQSGRATLTFEDLYISILLVYK